MIRNAFEQLAAAGPAAFDTCAINLCVASIRDERLFEFILQEQRRCGLRASQILNLESSLELPARQAGGFYGILAFATAAGVGLAALKLNPIKLLFWTAVINGIAAVPIMVVMMVLVSDRRGREANLIPGWLRGLGWLATALMALAVAVFFLSFIR